MVPVASLLVTLAFVLSACTASSDPAAAPSPDPATPSPTPTPSPSSQTPSPSPQPEAAFDADEAFSIVEQLAALGPREATTGAYRRAARLVEQRLRTLGLEVRRQELRVPAGVSWGIEVPAGDTWNVIAEPPGFDSAEPHAIVGAHLDTVPQAPGANDNASGVAVMLELARMTSLEPPPVPVVFIAFAAEEPRGSGDDRHHYGSQHYVEAIGDDAEILGMISLDRVGIGSGIRACTGGLGNEEMAERVLDVADDIGVRARPCRNRASDHWSFEKAGYAGVRLLGAEHPTYHTARDLPNVVERRQLRRAGELAWATLRSLEA